MTQDAIVFGRVFPDGSERPAVRQRNVLKLLSARDRDSMRPIDIDWHVAGGYFVIDTGPARSETNQRNRVGSFRQNVDEVVFIRLGLSKGRGSAGEEDKKQERC